MKTKISMPFLVAILTTGCATKENKNTARGAGIGGASGAVLGGIIGNQRGKRNEGAVIGGTVGAAIGGVVGRRMDRQAKELNQIAETKRTEEGLVTQLKSDILFDTAQDDLKPTAEQNLGRMAEIMKKYPENVLTVKGFTDSTGTEEYNEELAKDRAEAVRRFLISNGLASHSISVVGYGEENPVADNSTASGRQKNRRVEIEVTVDESKVPQEVQR